MMFAHRLEGIFGLKLDAPFGIVELGRRQTMGSLRAVPPVYVVHKVVAPRVRRQAMVWTATGAVVMGTASMGATGCMAWY